MTAPKYDATRYPATRDPAFAAIVLVAALRRPELFALFQLVRSKGESGLTVREAMKEFKADRSNMLANFRTLARAGLLLEDATTSEGAATGVAYSANESALDRAVHTLTNFTRTAETR